MGDRDKSSDGGGGTLARVYVGGLTDAIKKEDLESEFEKYGKLDNVWIALNPPGFAFVTFINCSDAETACDNLNGIDLMGSKLRVEMAKGRSGRGRFRGGGGGGGGGRGRGGFGGGGGGGGRDRGLSRGGGRGFRGGGRGGGGGGGRNFNGRNDYFRGSRDENRFGGRDFSRRSDGFSRGGGGRPSGGGGDFPRRFDEDNSTYRSRSPMRGGGIRH